NGIVVAGRNEAKCGALLARRTIVSVQTNERLARHCKSLCERGTTEIPCGKEPTGQQPQRKKCGPDVLAHDLNTAGSAVWLDWAVVAAPRTLRQPENRP